MTTIAFDTHDFFNQLKEAGFTDQQAEAITKLQKATIEATLEQARHDYELDQIATKRDIRELELKIEVLKAETGRMIAETKAELVRWIVGAGFLQTSLIIGALLKMAHLI